MASHMDMSSAGKSSRGLVWLIRRWSSPTSGVAEVKLPLQTILLGCRLDLKCFGAVGAALKAHVIVESKGPLSVNGWCFGSSRQAGANLSSTAVASLPWSSSRPAPVRPANIMRLGRFVAGLGARHGKEGLLHTCVRLHRMPVLL